MEAGKATSRPRVLVVDDEAVVRNLVEAILEDVGVECILVKDVGSALASLDALTFDLVVTDVQLGGRSGIEVVRHLVRRKLAVPVIAMSGTWTAAQRLEMQGLGCTDMVEKPFNVGGFLNLVRKLLAPAVGASSFSGLVAPSSAPRAVPAPAVASARPDGGTAAPPPPRILVVDDDAAVARLVNELLSEEGWSVVEAHHPRDGFRRMSGETFDLVILDILMPGEDGLTLLGRLRALRLIDETPVLFLTAFASEENRRRAAALGAAGMMAKPFEARELAASVRALLSRFGRGAPLASPATTEGSLSDVRVTDLCRMVDLCGRSLVASIVQGPEIGELVFDSRGLTHAAIIRGGVEAAAGEPAFQEIVRWTSGRFYLCRGDVKRRQSLSRPLEELLRTARNHQAERPQGN
ncbi:MAG: response regulator [Planctomycetes bacterium]|nr:response regulator [Planctomycetota bacterium]